MKHTSLAIFFSLFALLAVAKGRVVIDLLGGATQG